MEAGDTAQMNTEQQKESEELKKFISDRFDQIDRRLETQINELKIEVVKVESRLSQEINGVESKLSQKINGVESKLSQKINGVESKLSQEINGVESKLSQEIIKVDAKLGEQIGGIKVDITWIKWLFGGLLSFILVLLSVIITVLFKLVG
jgi:archaellum component FlaC